MSEADQSSQQPTLDVDWEARQVERQRERALAGGARYGRRQTTTTKSNDTASADEQCRNCGSHIPTRYARVLGDNQDRVWACARCVDHDEIFRGAAAGLPTEKGGNL